MIILLIIFFVFIFNFFFTPFLINISQSRNLLKNVRDRDLHKIATPNNGGIGLFLSFILGNFLFLIFRSFFDDFLFFNFYENMCFLFLCFFIFLLGLLDDLYKVKYFVKLIFQFSIASFLVFFLNMRIESFYGLFNLFIIPNIYLNIFSVVVVVFIINSYNFIDGVDGLASIIGIFIFLIFSILFYYNNYYFDFFYVY